MKINKKYYWYVIMQSLKTTNKVGKILLLSIEQQIQDHEMYNSFCCDQIDHNYHNDLVFSRAPPRMESFVSWVSQHVSSHPVAK